MKVFQYLHVPHGGHVEYVREICALLNEGGIECGIIGPRGSSGSDVLPVVTPPSRSARGLRRLVDRLVTYRRQPRELADFVADLSLGPNDVIHMQSVPSIGASRVIKMLRRSTSAKVFVTVHNVTPHRGGSAFVGLVHRSHRRAWNLVDGITVHTKTQATALASLKIQVPISVVPHPVWRVDRSEKPPAPDSYLFFGVLRENKGVIQLLDALAELDDPTCTIAGSGTEAMVERLYREIKVRGLHRCNLLPGFVAPEDVSDLFAEHRVVVLPYEQFDAQSGVLNLAIAHRRPCVVTAVGALPETVERFGIGEVVDRSLSHTMRRCQEMAAKGGYSPGLARAAEVLSGAATADLLREAYARATR